MPHPGVGTDLVSYDKVTRLAYHHDGFTSTILETALLELFNNTARTVAMTDRGDLIDDFQFFATHLIRRFRGFTGTQREAITSPSTNPVGVSWWGEGQTSNLASYDFASGSIYEHIRFTESLINSSVTGRSDAKQGLQVTSEPPSFILGDQYVNWDDGLGGTDRHLRDGTLVETVAKVTWNYDMLGVTWDGVNMIQAFDFISLVLIIRRHVGFSNTTDVDIAEPGLDTGGICHFVVYNPRGSRRQRQIKSLIRSRRRRSH